MHTTTASVAMMCNKMRCWMTCCENEFDPYRARFASLMDELVKLVNSLGSNAQMARELSESSGVTTTHGYYSEGKYIAYSNALAWLQEVMRNA